MEMRCMHDDAYRHDFRPVYCMCISKGSPVVRVSEPLTSSLTVVGLRRYLIVVGLHLRYEFIAVIAPFLMYDLRKAVVG